MGEDGHYTHGDGDWPSQHEPACFVWYSDKYASYYPEKISSLKANKDKKYNTSFLFHSILDAADVTSSYINSKEDIFKKVSSFHSIDYSE
jgi:glucan phosphoethanolaminetransferase (alkaline phosphatase superfamily)